MNHSVLEQSLDDKFCGNSAVPPAVERFYGKAWVRGLLILSGTVAAGLGMIAVVVPLLPTTPFLLLASACYVRSSQPLYNRLLNNRWTGEYIRNFREGRGMPLRAKVVSIALLWVSLGCSAFMVQTSAVLVILTLVAVGVPPLILSIPTLRQ